MKISKDIIYVGVDDHQIDLFEGQYIVPEGMAYNSYVIKDEKIAVMDAVDANFVEEWLGKVAEAVGDKNPDYLIVQHMEPDHSAGIKAFIEKYPEATVVSTLKSFDLMRQFYCIELTYKKLVVKQKDSLALGEHNLTFVTAPMVHWPEVMFTYDAKDKVLFSADAFGKFGALDTAEEEWDCEARRYYFGIVGKFGPQVQSALKKVSAFEISTICPLHGPVLSDDLSHYLNQYNTWSSYGVESEGICIAYTSVYGHTKEAAELLADTLTKKGCPNVAITDLAREDQAEAVEDAFRYGTLVLATTTYNNGVFPIMCSFIHHLVDHNYCNRKIAFIENGSWAPSAAKGMEAMLASCKNITYAENKVTIVSALNDTSRAQIEALAEELMK